MSKRIPLQKSKQLIWLNRRPDKRMRLTLSFILKTRVCKFKIGEQLQILYSSIAVCSKNE